MVEIYWSLGMEGDGWEFVETLEREKKLILRRKGRSVLVHGVDVEHIMQLFETLKGKQGDKQIVIA